MRKQIGNSQLYILENGALREFITTLTCIYQGSFQLEKQQLGSIKIIGRCGDINHTDVVCLSTGFIENSIEKKMMKYPNTVLTFDIRSTFAHNWTNGFMYIC